MQMTSSFPFLVVYGPTGVGKTAFVDQLAIQIPCEIINMDSGQFYEPLTIGTAKPAWRTASVPHHLFDIITTPSLPTVVAYREQVCVLIKEINQRGKLPILVGGSGFYLKSLLFPPHYKATTTVQHSQVIVTAENAERYWHQLHAIDPVRAAEINPHDPYRIQRALDIWYGLGIKPSELKPVYSPPGPYHIVYLTRDRADLHARIADRTKEMLTTGWVEEVQSLPSEWIAWIKEKKIIGYLSVHNYLEGLISRQQMEMDIVHQTRQYAKRQETFWRMLKKEIGSVDDASKITELNLTSADIHLYIMKLSKSVVTLLNRQIKSI